MGNQLSVETFSSSVDKEGNRYWASFDPYPFKAGSRKLAYVGLLNGEGPLVGKKCIVKANRKGRLPKDEWLHEKERAALAQRMASYYNETVGEHDYRIIFTCPILTEIDQLSDCICLSDIMGKPKKRMAELEYVSIEHYLRGHFEDFEYGWVPLDDLEVPEAFSHFSWCRSEGEMLISNLQGVKTSVDFQFTGPLVHSVNERFGSRDLGLDGIKGFFKLHECNRICRHWPRLGDGVDLRDWGLPALAHKRTSPSAPPYSPHDVSNFPQAPPPYNSLEPSMQFPPQYRYAMNYRSQFSSTGAQDTPAYPNDRFQGLPYMWYMQQTSYAIAPPPYSYCSCKAARSGGVSDRETRLLCETGRGGSREKLLPAKSDEMLTEREEECVTYL